MKRYHGIAHAAGGGQIDGDRIVTITVRRHLTSIRYAVTVMLQARESCPPVGATFSLGDMAVVRVIALRGEPRRQAATANDRERTLTVETLETIGRLPDLF